MALNQELINVRRERTRVAKMLAARKKLSDAEKRSPGFQRPIQVALAHQYPDLHAFKEGRNTEQRQVFTPAHRSPVTGGSDRARGGSKEKLTKHHA